MPAAYPVVISDGHGQVAAKGRTANISQHGVFVVTSATGALKAGGTIDPRADDSRQVLTNFIDYINS